jgi:tetratricopeptide (TPR) repeat protein
MQTEYSPVEIFIKRAPTLTLFCLALTNFIAAPRAGANAAGDPHFKRGLQLSLQKKWPQAEGEYRKAIALDPKNATYKSYLADALAAQGKFGQAQDSYQQSDKAKKNHPQTGYKKPAARQPTSPRPAISKPRTGTSRTPTLRAPGSGTSGGSTRRIPDIPFPPVGDDDANTQIITRDGQVFKFPKSPGGDIQITDGGGEIHDAIETDPNFQKGQDYAEEGKWPQAEAAFRAALKNHSSSTEGWSALGDVYFKQQNWAKAEQAHRTAVRLDPNESYLHAQLANDLLKQGRRDEAGTEAKEAIRLGLEDHEVFDELGLHVNVAR